MGLNGNSLSNIKNGTSNLVAGTDYTVLGNVVTIKKGTLHITLASSDRC